MEKRLGSTLIAGDVMIAIDNCEEPLGGGLLCQAMTQTSLKVRILGSSINAEVPSNATVFATGNNLTLAGDMTRRAIRATLDAGVERLELRAFHIAGRPSQTVPLGSCTAWSG